MLPRSHYNTFQHDICREWHAIICGRSFHCDHQWHIPQLVASFDIRRSISRLDCFSSAQMTRVHQALALLPQGRLGQVVQALFLRKGGETLFFKPSADGVARYAKGSFKTAQTAALFICTQDFVSSCCGMSITARICTTLFATCVTKIFLFAIWSDTIANQVIAPTMPTGLRASIHGVNPFW